jgi:hypothetical protein
VATPTEKINELSRVMATHVERLDNVRKDVDAINGGFQKTNDSLHEALTKLAVIEERLGELKKGLEESSKRRWAIVPSLVGGVIGGVLGFLGHFILRLLFPGH